MAERDRLLEQAVELQAGRDRAVRELKLAESTAATRLEQLRALREEHRALQERAARVPAPSALDRTDTPGVAAPSASDVERDRT
ncbi:hypothetical protein QWY28_23595, partial [Nocardioides sp. SOB77]